MSNLIRGPCFVQWVRAGVRSEWLCLVLVVVVSVLLCVSGRAQSTNESSAVSPTRLPPITVTGTGSVHEVESESDLVGPAKQPEWSTRRVFPETDVYVIPTGEIEFNQFFISSHPRHGGPESLFESELEIGLPWRTQFDVEMNYGVREGKLSYDSTMIEMPHALADWGKIPLNPAINAGWRFRTDGPDSYIFRALFAQQFGQRFYFGANLSFERQVSGELETDYEFNSALNYRLIDGKLSVGAQLVVEYETARESEFDAEESEFESKSVHSTEVLFGPSILYRPSKRMYIGATPLFGMTKESPTVEAFFLVGFDFEAFRRGSSGQEKEEGAPMPRLRRPR